jgi:membrane-bound lytic murein transglycosylase B
MSEAGRGSQRRPAHARPSLLAPTRSVAIVGGLLAVAGLAIAGCAAVAASAASNPRVAAQPSPVRPLAVTGGTLSAARPSPASATAQIVTAASGGGGTVWFLTDQHPSAPPPRHGTQVIAPQPGTGAPSSALAASGIPITALQAYRQAAAREAKRRPSCGLTWPLLGGIGRVESNHGRFAGAILHSDGLSTPPVIGIPLNGNGTALILDTDHGRLDGDTVYDRAVGPMQFIPSTWAGWGVDANHDGVADPFNIFDAAAAAADYLCAAGRNLRTYAGEVQAVRSYNNSDAYISLVLGVERVYAGGVGITVPIVPTNPDPGTTKPPKHHPHLPPVDPGHPPGLEHDPHNPCAPSGSAEDHSAAPSPSRTYDPTGPQDPHKPKPCPTHSGSSTPPTGGGHHSSSSGTSSGPSSSTPPPSSSSPPPTSPDPSSSDPGDPTDSGSSVSAPSSDVSADPGDSGGGTSADAMTASSADSSGG